RTRAPARSTAAGSARRRRAEPQEPSLNMADNEPPSPPRPQTFQGLGSLRQALQQARTAPAVPVPTPSVPDHVQPQIDALGRSYATGKRKNAVARVWIKPGAGRIDVNGRESPVYFARPVLRMLINQPLVATNRLGQFDVGCTVKGGGFSGRVGSGGRRSRTSVTVCVMPMSRCSR